MTTTLYLIRHGEVINPSGMAYGNLPVSLTEKGKEQIRNLAKKLRDENVTPDIIISSPLRRTIETTEELKVFFPKTPIIYENNLQEITGNLQDMKNDAIHALGDYYHAKECLERNIESPESITDRMYKIAKEVLEIHRGKTVFVISHGDPLVWLLWKILHPALATPSIVTIKNYYLMPGTAWKLVFDLTGAVEERKRIA